MLSGKAIGRERQHQIMLLEAIPETSGGLDDKMSTVSLQVEKLTEARQSDGLFAAYDDANMAKVRSSFRLPSAVLGQLDNVNFAAATTAIYQAETQVFLPERQDHDEFLNKRLINHNQGLNIRTCKLESRGPRVTNPDQVVKTLTAINSMGGVTPRTAIALVNETMQLSLPQYPLPGEEGYESWMDLPISISLRREMTRTQQKGEGDSTHVEQETKTPKVKDREESGATGPETDAVEHGQEGDSTVA
jgi:capsid portal protein